MTTITQRDDRISLRSTPETKQQIITASAILGITATEFILSIVKKEAKKIISKAETVTLNNTNRDKFLDLLDNPPEPNKALLKLAKDNQQHMCL